MALQTLTSEWYGDRVSEGGGSEIYYYNAAGDFMFDIYDTFHDDAEDNDIFGSELSINDDDYEFVDNDYDDISKYKALKSLPLEFSKLSNIPLRVVGNYGNTIMLMYFNGYGQVVAWKMKDPYTDAKDGNGRLIAYNIDISDPDLVKYDPLAGYSYWKIDDTEAVSGSW